MHSGANPRQGHRLGSILVEYVEITDKCRILRGPPRNAGLFRIPVLISGWFWYFACGLNEGPACDSVYTVPPVLILGTRTRAENMININMRVGEPGWPVFSVDSMTFIEEVFSIQRPPEHPGALALRER